MARRKPQDEPIVITGIGMLASVGSDRESVWRAVREGRSGVRKLSGVKAIPDGLLLAATTDIAPEYPHQLKVISMIRAAAAEAIEDSGVDLARIDRDRVGCAISGHVGDTEYLEDPRAYNRPPEEIQWWQQFLPCSAGADIARHYGFGGPRISHSVACASGLVDILAAARAIRDGQCDMAIGGSAEAIHPIFAAGFHRMKVLAYDDPPERAARPFDVDRKGFVMGEGAAVFMLERLSHAVRRGARIYAEILSSTNLAQAHHVTGLDAESEALTYLIDRTLHRAQLAPADVGYINAHGTGTKQNDLVEAVAIRRAFGPARQNTCVSSSKSMLGHLVNASGSVELAITTLALRDGFAPPTLNLQTQDPECDFDCIPMVGRRGSYEHALKLSVAFGGHLVAVALRRWPGAQSQIDTPTSTAA